MRFNRGNQIKEITGKRQLRNGTFLNFHSAKIDPPFVQFRGDRDALGRVINTNDISLCGDSSQFADRSPSATTNIENGIVVSYDNMR